MGILSEDRNIIPCCHLVGRKQFVDAIAAVWNFPYHPDVNFLELLTPIPTILFIAATSIWTIYDPNYTEHQQRADPRELADGKQERAGEKQNGTNTIHST